MVPVEWVDAREWEAIELAFTGIEECKQVKSEDPATERIGAKRQLPAWFTAPPERQYSVRKKFQPLCFRGEILYSRTWKEVEDAALEIKEEVRDLKKELAPGETIPIGFDLEWKPTFTRGVAPGRAAVLQLCLDSSHCYVMHIIHSGIPQPLRELLEDSSICKVGVAAHEDGRKLRFDHGVCVNNIVDLIAMANRKLGTERRWSLSSLAEQLTCRVVAKPPDIRCGNWELLPLSKAQLDYAATDAFASLYIYQVLATFLDPVAAEAYIGTIRME